MNGLPYTYARNDCEACREHDADFQFPGGDHDPTSARAERYCRRCLGERLLWTAQLQCGPVTGGSADHHRHTAAT